MEKLLEDKLEYTRPTYVGSSHIHVHVLDNDRRGNLREGQKLGASVMRGEIETELTEEKATKAIEQNALTFLVYHLG
jgi:hypothetical protein